MSRPRPRRRRNPGGLSLLLVGAVAGLLYFLSKRTATIADGTQILVYGPRAVKPAGFSDGILTAAWFLDNNAIPGADGKRWPIASTPNLPVQRVERTGTVYEVTGVVKRTRNGTQYIAPQTIRKGS